MFLKFFGLKDNPFKLVFDPTYLFMGRHHEEAMAHLHYAVAEGEGFTAITGERGIGKSTLCRAFVDSMAAKASTAFLSSPLPTAKDLLQRMNLQFGVSAEGQSAKDLIDALNAYLMQQRIAGRNVAVFIDDAQTLAPEVLEQVRLISNQETTRDKLIQIVLIGEPELMKMLDSRELRQMGQRVSVCYEIGPLAAEETAAYIQHRLSVASAGPPVRFDPEAVRLIFRYSRGNPRRVNMACSAALAAAFKARQKGVSAAIAQAVIQDLVQQEAGSRGLTSGRRKRTWALAAALGLVDEIDDEHDIELQRGDRIVVPSRPRTVFVTGEVNRPGLLVFLEGEDVIDYIDRAGGPTDSADYAVLTQPTGESSRVNFG